MNTPLYSPQLQATLSAQEELAPSPVVKERIMAEIRQPAQSRLTPVWRWAMAITVTLLLGLVLWCVVQPGIVSEWKIDTNTSSTTPYLDHIESRNKPAAIVISNFRVRSTNPSGLMAAMIVITLAFVVGGIWVILYKPKFLNIPRI